MRSDYKICPLCGAALDIGEQCNCMEYKEPHGQQIRPGSKHPQEKPRSPRAPQKEAKIVLQA